MEIDDIGYSTAAGFTFNRTKLECKSQGEGEAQ